MSTLYEKYMAVQEEYPQAVVIKRLGDFYEVMGENAKTVAVELDITLTSRNVGLEERVPMCGFPYHICEQYVERILKRRSVVIVEDGQEPKYILSHKAVNEEIDEESEDDDVVDLDLEEDFDDEDEEEKRPAVKDTSKRMSERKKSKQNLQISLFDFEVKESTREEKLKEWGLQYGSRVRYGKYRIYDAYLLDPTENEFAKFLKKEYGYSGSYLTNYSCESDAKGYRMRHRDRENPSNEFEIFLTWKEVAIGIADLIDKGKYFNDDEWEKYPKYQEKMREKERQRQAERQAQEDLIRLAIASAPDDRKQRILDEYAVTTELISFASFLTKEYGECDELTEEYKATYNAIGVWISQPNGALRSYLKWEEFAGKVCDCIEGDVYIDAPTRTKKAEMEM